MCVRVLEASFLNRLLMAGVSLLETSLCETFPSPNSHFSLHQVHQTSGRVDLAVFMGIHSSNMHLNFTTYFFQIHVL